eukprot:Plantae.Rhodophyta-Rhodochaete_pulchella.ctg681.p1 GENE.Plantae.Rhodophyta-Rhodochaete_pulchella.ctg681~~Plantae.Rhodophyta-Rhodochaete_pulchella.ctg681.p1  ORF type:complete len:904 (-),score=186.40 Plantae.Rhodophyta-Rhodochaete_pulchella.ctg681:2265-4976(-)
MVDETVENSSDGGDASPEMHRGPGRADSASPHDKAKEQNGQGGGIEKQDLAGGQATGGSEAPMELEPPSHLEPEEEDSSGTKKEQGDTENPEKTVGGASDCPEASSELDLHSSFRFQDADRSKQLSGGSGAEKPEKTVDGRSHDGCPSAQKHETTVDEISHDRASRLESNSNRRPRDASGPGDAQERFQEKCGSETVEVGDESLPKSALAGSLSNSQVKVHSFDGCNPMNERSEDGLALGKTVESAGRGASTTMKPDSSRVTVDIRSSNGDVHQNHGKAPGGAAEEAADNAIKAIDAPAESPTKSGSRNSLCVDDVKVRGSTERSAEKTVDAVERILESQEVALSEPMDGLCADDARVPSSKEGRAEKTGDVEERVLESPEIASSERMDCDPSPQRAARSDDASGEVLTVEAGEGLEKLSKIQQSPSVLVTDQRADGHDDGKDVSKFGSEEAVRQGDAQESRGSGLDNTGVAEEKKSEGQDDTSALFDDSKRKLQTNNGPDGGKGHSNFGSRADHQSYKDRSAEKTGDTVEAVLESPEIVPSEPIDCSPSPEHASRRDDANGKFLTVQGFHTAQAGVGLEKLPKSQQSPSVLVTESKRVSEQADGHGDGKEVSKLGSEEAVRQGDGQANCRGSGLDNSGLAEEKKSEGQDDNSALLDDSKSELRTSNGPDGGKGHSNFGSNADDRLVSTPEQSHDHCGLDKEDGTQKKESERPALPADSNHVRQGADGHIYGREASKIRSEPGHPLDGTQEQMQNHSRSEKTMDALEKGSGDQNSGVPVTDQERRQDHSGRDNEERHGSGKENSNQGSEVVDRLGDAQERGQNHGRSETILDVLEMESEVEDFAESGRPVDPQEKTQEDTGLDNQRSMVEQESDGQGNASGLLADSTGIRWPRQCFWVACGFH